MMGSRDIVVIDDHRPTCDLIAEVLSDAGYSVRIVQATDHAYATLERRQPDLILCNLRVNGISGLDLLTALRRHGIAVAVPVVIMTTDYQVVGDLDTQGFTDYLLKPFHLDELLNC